MKWALTFHNAHITGKNTILYKNKAEIQGSLIFSLQITYFNFWVLYPKGGRE